MDSTLIVTGLIGFGGLVVAVLGLRRSKKIDKVAADTSAAATNIAALDVLVSGLQTDRADDRKEIAELKREVRELRTQLQAALAEIAILRNGG